MSDSEIPIIGARPELAGKTVEICRSFSYKVNLKNPDGSPTYESCDFFASRKMECAAEEATWVSQQLFEECVAEVREAIIQFKSQRRKPAKMEVA